MPQASELMTVVGKIDPQSANNTTKATDYVDLSKFQEVLFVLQVGAIDAVIDFKLQEATDSSGTGLQDVSGKAITQLTAGDDNKIVLINFRADELTVASGYRYVRGLATLGNGSAQLVAAVALGVLPRFGPASDSKLAAVAQIVT